MNDQTTPPAASAATTSTPPAATAQATSTASAGAESDSTVTVQTPPRIRTQIGLPVEILGRGEKPGTVLIKRQNDGGIRVYNIADLTCERGPKALEAEIERVCAADKQL